MFPIALRSLIFYWRTNLAVAIGVAVATAVLTGALIVGDSMRSSLKNLTLQRLGEIDELLVSENFFRATLANELEQTKAFEAAYDKATPLILFPGGTVETNFGRLGKRRASQVSVLGISAEFWSFESDVYLERLNGNQPPQIAINQALADELKITAAQIAEGAVTITVRIPKLNQLPGDSAMAKQNDLIESLVELEVSHLVPTEGLGRFGLFPTQSDPLNVYLPIEMLQGSLSETVLKHKSEAAQANLILLSGKNQQPPSLQQTQTLKEQLRPALEDLGLRLKRVQRTFPQIEPSAKDDPGDAKNDTSVVAKSETIFDYWSLSTDRMVFTDATVNEIQAAIPTAKPAFTYLANDLRMAEQSQGVPFSMVSAIDFDKSFQPISAIDNEPIPPLQEDEIVLTEWAAKDIKAKVGESIKMTYFEPETTHGTQIEKSVSLKLVAIAKLAEPVEPFVIPRRGPMQLSKFDQRPEITNDPDLTPEVPGLTDADSIEAWDLPFVTADRIRAVDDEYWAAHRTTPKAYVSLATGQRLWNSRFGCVTNFRIPIAFGNADRIEQKLLEQIAANDAVADFGLQIVPIKKRGLAASAGSTPFDVLFLALSMFVIASALILVALLFRLGFQQRATEVGLLSATGFSEKSIRRLWLLEMSAVSVFGAVLGVMLGIAYAAMMIWGLTTWWVGAISRPFLELHLTLLTLAIGLFSGLLVCIATIFWSLRSASHQSTRSLLAGQIEPNNSRRSKKVSFSNRNRSKPWLIGLLLVGAIGLAIAASGLAGEAQAGSFMGAGFLVLTALLMLIYRWLKSAPRIDNKAVLGLISLAATNARRNPLRSTLTIGLVAVAAFLIAAVSAFRLAPTEQGTGGFDWIAQTSQPLVVDLATASGRVKALGAENQLAAGTEVYPFRVRAGEDASCNNLYQSTQPKVWGVADGFIESFDSNPGLNSNRNPNSATEDIRDETGLGLGLRLREKQPSFAWGGTLAQAPLEKNNPWQLLKSETAHAGTAADPIPTILDKNTANYSLKIYLLDSIFPVTYDSGETIHFRVVGFLSNTILQGSLIVSEADFVRAFPSVSGYQYFLIRGPEDEIAESSAATTEQILENRLSDYGFDARSATQVLSGFMQVQNTYLSTFQTLGALGLLLGTFGLAAVQLRSVFERQRELGLLRAVGFSVRRLGSLVLLENGFLLLAGLLIGIGGALFTTLPHWWLGNASVPWSELGIMFALIAVAGLLASFVAARQIFRLPLLQSLRG